MKPKNRFKQTKIGMIPEDWGFEELDKHANIIMGQSPESIFYNNMGEGMPFLQGIRTFGNTYPKYDTWTTKIAKQAKKGSILLSVRAPVGEVNIANQNICIGRGLMSIDGKNNLFIYYLFKAFKEYVVSKETGTVYGSVTREDISKLQFPFPPLPEQAAIASILSSLDNKIELNQSLNKTLEAIGQAIFKHWFVDFEFPNEKGKPYKSSGGEMVESELGEIPKGWKVGKLGDYVNIIKGCSYTSNDLKESQTALVTLKSINRGGGFNQEGYKEYIGEYGPEQVLENGDIVVAQTDLTQKAEVIGRPAIINLLGQYKKIIASLDLQIVRPKYNNSHWWVYHLLKMEDFHNHALAYTNGTTVLHLNKNAVPEYMASMPEDSILKRFDEMVKPIIVKMQMNEAEIMHLIQIRNSLLPKLMTGKIRVGIKHE